jgi:hypothetical protein
VPQGESQRGYPGRTRVALHRLFVSGLFAQGGEKKRVTGKTDMILDAKQSQCCGSSQTAQKALESQSSSRVSTSGYRSFSGAARLA